MMSFPPFSRLIRIVMRGKKQKAVLEALEILTENFRKAGLPEVLGPAECPLGIIAGNYRYHSLIPLPGGLFRYSQGGRFRTEADRDSQGSLPGNRYRSGASCFDELTFPAAYEYYFTDMQSRFVSLVPETATLCVTSRGL